MKKQTSECTGGLSGAAVAAAIAGAWCAVLLVGGLLRGSDISVLDPGYIVQMNPLFYGIAWLVVAGLLLIYGIISTRFVYGFTWIAGVAFSVWNASVAGSYAVTFAMCGLVALLTVLIGRVWRATDMPKRMTATASNAHAAKIAVLAITVIGGSVALFYLIASYLSYTTSPSANTGIYLQLMESLRTGFSFDTTLEFGESVSHLGAHISPIFLLYLPFYAIIPSPITLLCLQTLIVYSAVIPLWLIARRRGLSAWMSVVLCGLLVLSPAVLGGAAGSFHEYALLLPLLLWLFWALETDRRVCPWIFAALILCVRESAAIFLFSIGIFWWLEHRREKNNTTCRRACRIGLILAGISLLYFIISMLVLTYAGRGTLITRFSNITGIYATDFGTLAREILGNPALVLYELLTTDKIFYGLLLCLPLCLLPWLCGRASALIFLVPPLFMNLLSDFPLYHSPDFPYAFGISACLFYLSVLAVARLQTPAEHTIRLRRLTVLAVCFTLIIGAFRLADYRLFADYALTGHEEITTMDELLEVVDDSASVSAPLRLCPNLAARNELYALTDEVSTDIVVLDLREEWVVKAEAKYTVEYYQKQGYHILSSRDGVGAVLAKS